MSVTDYFLSASPAPPWSASTTLGLPAFGVVAALLVLLTLWTYLGRPQATGRRLLLDPRAAAAGAGGGPRSPPSGRASGCRRTRRCRPPWSSGWTCPQSMAVPDELGNQTAGRRRAEDALEKCQPLHGRTQERAERRDGGVRGRQPGLQPTPVNTTRPPAAAMCPQRLRHLPAAQSFERWQAERFVRAHLLIGDGQENGTRTPSEAEAGRWRKAGRPLSTFAVGRTDSGGDFKDVALRVGRAGHRVGRRQRVREDQVRPQGAGRRPRVRRTPRCRSSCRSTPARRLPEAGRAGAGAAVAGEGERGQPCRWSPRTGRARSR